VDICIILSLRSYVLLSTVTKTGVESSLGTTQALIAEAKGEKEQGGQLANLLNNVAIFLCLYGLVAAVIIGAYTVRLSPIRSLSLPFVFCFTYDCLCFYVRKGMNFGSTAGESIKLAFVILSTILPVTMPLVLTTTLAVGAQELAKDDAVVQRFSAIPEMAGMDILCSDKTGTLTLGQMSIIEDDSLTFHDDVTVKEMMELALVCTRIEHSDAIDAAITKYFDDPAGVLSDYEIKKFIPFDPATKKVTAVARKKSTGEEIIVVKGAPPVLMVRSRSKGFKIEYQAVSNQLLTIYDE
jgi:magnesium-transporting ATPase (P-type)